jgi:hypothetical protein
VSFGPSYSTQPSISSKSRKTRCDFQQFRPRIESGTRPDSQTRDPHSDEGRLKEVYLPPLLLLMTKARMRAALQTSSTPCTEKGVATTRLHAVFPLTQRSKSWIPLGKARGVEGYTNILAHM